MPVETIPLNVALRALNEVARYCQPRAYVDNICQLFAWSREQQARVHVIRTDSFVAPVRYGRSIDFTAARNANRTETVKATLTASRSFAA